MFTAEDAVARAARWSRRDSRAPVHRGRRRRRLSRRRGILTSEGGKASHAALVARGMGRPAVTGAADLEIDLKRARCGSATSSCTRATSSRSTGAPATITTDDVPLVEAHVDARFETVLRWCDELRAARRARQRGHAGGRHPRPPLRRRGHRAVPDRAHVHGGRSPAEDAGDDHGRGRRRPPRRARRAAPAPAERLRGAVRGDGRLAGHDSPARSAPARVPARPLRAPRGDRARADRPQPESRRAGASVRPRALARGDQPDARHARRAARRPAAGGLRDAGARDRARRGRGARAHAGGRRGSRS